jgi:hypothetical protein
MDWTAGDEVDGCVQLLLITGEKSGNKMPNDGTSSIQHKARDVGGSRQDYYSIPALKEVSTEKYGGLDS